MARACRSVVWPALLFLLIPRDASADMAWGFYPWWLDVWWPVPLGLLAEWPAVRILTGRSWRGSLTPNILMNAASLAVGALVAPFLDLRAALFTHSGLTALLLLVPLLSTAIELAVLRLRYAVPGGLASFGTLWMVNVTSVTLFTLAIPGAVQP